MTDPCRCWALGGHGLMNRPKHIYKITYPNGKIYVGMDLTGDLTYMGSPSAAPQIAAELGLTERLPQHPLPRYTTVRRSRRNRYIITVKDLVLQKEILWESETAPDIEVRALEMRFIRETSANDPTIGYNLVPKYVG